MVEVGQVLLVDENDRPLRLADKMEAHELGLLHRAFSAYVFQTRGTQRYLLLQQRAETKYHFGGLWTNTCCGHPLEHETPAEAGMRRLAVELNIDCRLEEVGAFKYHARAANGLIEHEIDHVLVGTYAGSLPAPNPAEVASVRWIGLDELEHELATEPARFTPWFAQGYAVLRGDGALR